MRHQYTFDSNIMSIQKPIIDCSISGRNSAGKLYGTCKLHNESLPLRPIDSMINTPTYKVAKFIDTMIKPYIPKTPCVENNLELKKTRNQYEHKEGDYCISFGVVPLFTNIVNKVQESEIPKRNIKTLHK